jgi:hypothetical protein
MLITSSVHLSRWSFCGNIQPTVPPCVYKLYHNFLKVNLTLV